MFVNVAVLKETQPHERRVALVPSVTARLIKLGAQLHMESGAGVESKFVDRSFEGVVFIEDRHKLVADADVVLAVNPPAEDVVDAMRRSNSDLLYLCGKGAFPRTTVASEEDHLFCDGTDPAHHPGAVHGRSLQPVCTGGILRGRTWSYPSCQGATQNHHSGGGDWASQGADHGPRSRRLGGRCDRTPSRSCRRRL